MRSFFMFLLLASCAEAGTNKQQATASVAVALVQLEIADERPALPDHPPNTSAQPQSNSLPRRNSEPMRIDWQSQVRSRINDRPVVTFYTGEKAYGNGWCHHCPRYQKLFSDGNDRVQVIYSTEIAPGDQVYPALRFHGSGGDCLYPANKHGDYKLPDSLDELADIVERNTPSHSYEAAGSAGVVHAKQQISDAINQFRHYVGEQNPVSVEWERNGIEQLPMFACSEWTTRNIFGTEGRFEFSSPHGTYLPVKQFAFGYRLRGNDIIVDPDPVVLDGLANRLNPSQSQVYGELPAGMIGIDDMLVAYNVFSMLRDICALLRPSCDLELPSELIASIVLDDNTLNVTFDKPATVRLTWLFTFRMQIKSVAISEQRVFVEFGGNRFVKSREFAVQ